MNCTDCKKKMQQTRFRPRRNLLGQLRKDKKMRYVVSNTSTRIWCRKCLDKLYAPPPNLEITPGMLDGLFSKKSKRAV